jgi:hypothetical protein
MKTLLVSALLASAALVAVAADSPSIGGVWKVHSSIAGTESDATCTLTQKENLVTGSCTTESGDATASGKVDGAKITWSYDTDYNGTAITVKFSGTLDSATNKIAGTVGVEQFGVDGDFTATLSK